MYRWMRSSFLRIGEQYSSSGLRPSEGIAHQFLGIMTAFKKASQCGYVVSTSAFRQGVPGSNPIAARKSCEVYPGLGILQPQWNPYPTFTPPPAETRLLFNHGPQYGSAVCHHSRRSGRRPQQQNPTWEWRQHSWAEFPMMVIHHTHLPLHFFHRWRPSGGSWCCTTTH